MGAMWYYTHARKDKKLHFSLDQNAFFVATVFEQMAHRKTNRKRLKMTSAEYSELSIQSSKELRPMSWRSMPRNDPTDSSAISATTG
jgi:hypothetical protein